MLYSLHLNDNSFIKVTVMTYQKTLVILAIFLLINGCSSKELYNATQMQSQHHCDQKVGVERDECLQQLNKKSYEEYEKERQEIIKPNK